MPTYFNIDIFEANRSTFAFKNTSKKGSIKENLSKYINTPESTTDLTEDLKQFLFLAKTDEEIKLLTDALKKYNVQNKDNTNGFTFGARLIKLLYVENKTDLALELFLSEDRSLFFNNTKFPSSLLANKLLILKRYDDMFKVFQILLSLHKKIPSIVSFDFIIMLTEALLEKNTKEALAQAKDLLKICQTEELATYDPCLYNLILLALNQNDGELAFELFSQLRTAKTDIRYNIQALCFIQLGRLDEAFSTIDQLILDQPRRINSGKFFKMTINKLKEAVAKSENSAEKQAQLDTLIAKITQENLFMNIDFKEYCNRPIHFTKSRRDAENMQQNPANQNRENFLNYQNSRFNQSQENRFGHQDFCNREPSRFENQNSGFRNQRDSYNDRNDQRRPNNTQQFQERNTPQREQVPRKKSAFDDIF